MLCVPKRNCQISHHKSGQVQILTVHSLPSILTFTSGHSSVILEEVIFMYVHSSYLLYIILVLFKIYTANSARYIFCLQALVHSCHLLHMKPHGLDTS